MTIVDLRGRERDSEVLSLLDPDPAWMLIGWSRDGVLVACAGVERLSADDITVRALAARDDDDARALLDALARASTGSRIVAEPAGPSAAAFRASGFRPDATSPGGERLVRLLDEPPAPPDAVRAASLEEVEAAIRAAWGRETSDDPDEWSEANPARGQCAVTALLIRELLGGDILVANVLRDGRRVDRHAWNELPSGLTLDLTREQFRNDERFGEPRVEEPVLTHLNPERFATLRARVRSRLGLDG